jgi:chromosome segregation ATPase
MFTSQSLQRLSSLPRTTKTIPAHLAYELLEDFERRVAALEAQLASAHERIAELESSLQQAATDEREFADLRSKVVRLTSETRELRKLRAELEADLELERENREATEHALEITSERADRLEAALAERDASDSGDAARRLQQRGQAALARAARRDTSPDARLAALREARDCGMTLSPAQTAELESLDARPERPARRRPR